MNKKLRITLGIALAVLMTGLFLVISPHALYAIADMSVQAGVNAAHGNNQPTELFGASGIFTSITNVLLFTVGALSVVMVIVGGLRYVVSGGNSTAVTGAKNTILYAIVGILVAFLAYAAVNFLLGSLSGNGVNGTNV
jgi:hypothetical protein